MSSCPAAKSHRTDIAFGFAIWHTDNCAEFHQCLIEISGVLPWHDLLKLIFYPFLYRLLHDITIILYNPGDHAKYISIYCRNRYIISDRCNCSCCIASDSLKGKKFLVRCRKHTIIFLHNRLCRNLHIPDAVVIPKSLPQFEKLLLRALCKCRRIRKFFCEPAKIWLHCLHSRLLQHDLRYPGIIGLVPVSPWKAALILPVPLCPWLYNVIQHSSSPVLFFVLLLSVSVNSTLSIP